MEKKKEAITESMSIVDIVQKHPETMPVFMKYGMHCLGCIAARFETLGQGAEAHNIDVKKFVAELNEAASKKKK